MATQSFCGIFLPARITNLMREGVLGFDATATWIVIRSTEGDEGYSHINDDEIIHNLGAQERGLLRPLSAVLAELFHFQLLTFDHDSSGKRVLITLDGCRAKAIGEDELNKRHGGAIRDW